MFIYLYYLYFIFFHIYFYIKLVSTILKVTIMNGQKQLMESHFVRYEIYLKMKFIQNFKLFSHYSYFYFIQQFFFDNVEQSPKNNYRFKLYSGHDSTILSVMRTLGYDIRVTPYYAAIILIELHEDE